MTEHTFGNIIFIFLLSLSSSLISGMVTFGDAIIFYLQIHLIHSYAPHWFHGIPNLSEANSDGSYDPIPYSKLFIWAILLLSIRGFCMTLLMLKFVWAEKRVDYLKYCCPLAMIGTWFGCWCLTHYGESPYLPYFFAVVFGSFASVMIGLRIYRVATGEDQGKKKNKKKNKVITTKNENPDVVVGNDDNDQKEVEMKKEESHNNEKEATNNITASSASTPVVITGIPAKSSRNASTMDLLTFPPSSSSSSSLSSPRKSKKNPTIAEIDEQLEAERKALENAPPKIDSEDQAKLNDPQYISRTKFFLSVMCLAAGFTGGISNIASSPVVVVAISYNFPKTLARGTMPFIFCAVMGTRNIYNSQSGEVNLSNSIPETLSMIAGGLIALTLGNKIAAKLSSDQFILIVTCMLLLAALTLGNAPSGVILTVLILEFLYYFWEFGGNDDDDDNQQIVVVVKEKNKKNENENQDEIIKG